MKIRYISNQLNETWTILVNLREVEKVARREHTHAQLKKTIYRLKYTSQKVATKVRRFSSYASIFRQEFAVLWLKSRSQCRKKDWEEWSHCILYIRTQDNTIMLKRRKGVSQRKVFFERNFDWKSFRQKRLPPKTFPTIFFPPNLFSRRIFFSPNFFPANCFSRRIIFFSAEFFLPSKSFRIMWVMCDRFRYKRTALSILLRVTFRFRCKKSTLTYNISLWIKFLFNNTEGLFLAYVYHTNFLYNEKNCLLKHRLALF